MGLDRAAMRRGGSFIVAFAAATFGVVAPAQAIETGGAPQLPPPPPPPLTAPPSGAPGAPRTAPKAAPAPPPPASSSAGASASVGVSTSAPPAADAGPDTGPHALDTRWFIAPMLGFASHYLDFGFGLRGGKTLDDHIYIGGTFLYQIGEGGSVSGGTINGVSTSASWSSSGFYVGPEGGYDFDLRVVVVRPYMGLGLFSWTSSAFGPAGGGATSSTQLVAWPGCTVIWSVPHTDFFLGGDLRVVTVPAARSASTPSAVCTSGARAMTTRRLLPPSVAPPPFGAAHRAVGAAASFRRRRPGWRRPSPPSSSPRSASSSARRSQHGAYVAKRAAVAHKAPTAQSVVRVVLTHESARVSSSPVPIRSRTSSPRITSSRAASRSSSSAWSATPRRTSRPIPRSRSSRSIASRSRASSA